MISKKGAIIGLIIIVAALAFSAVAFKGSVVSYVSFAEAMQATDTSVQIMGAPVQGMMGYNDAEHALHFYIRDDQGVTMAVVYHGPKPEDMDTASAKGAKIAVQGTYDPTLHTFVADKLLVKCPSKYNGTGGVQQRTYHSTPS